MKYNKNKNKPVKNNYRGCSEGNTWYSFKKKSPKIQHTIYL